MQIIRNLFDKRGALPKSNHSLIYGNVFKLTKLINPVKPRMLHHGEKPKFQKDFTKF